MDFCATHGLLNWCGSDGAKFVDVKEESPVPEKLGRAELTQAQQCALNDMKQKIRYFAEDKELLRFLIARKWDVDAAIDQFEAMMQWRRDHDVDRVRGRALGPFGPDAADVLKDSRLSRNDVEMFPQLRLVEPSPNEGALIYYGQTLAFGFDKKGQPIQIQNGGLAGWRFRDMLRVIGGSDNMMASLVRMHELQAARMEEASRKLGRPITKQVVITNASGMPLRPHPLAVAAFKDFLIVSSRYYPESLAVLFVVNAPPFFVALYKLIQSWLDPVTASKIQVLGRNFQSVLLEHIDADQLPRDYGGTVDFDILGETWGEQDCGQCIATCRQALQQRASEPYVASPQKGDVEVPAWPRLPILILSVLLVVSLYGIP
mmetsp:Transcript_11438/g.27438  ORF Transcript_11438/g.27438 Transcript_11438/m.27438 type:complete len:374 (+) Transcript_11438:49-1170(+)